MRIRKFLQEFLPLRETEETLGILLIAQKVVDEFLLNLFFCVTGNKLLFDFGGDQDHDPDLGIFLTERRTIQRNLLDQLPWRKFAIFKCSIPCLITDFLSDAVGRSCTAEQLDWCRRSGESSCHIDFTFYSMNVIAWLTGVNFTSVSHTITSRAVSRCKNPVFVTETKSAHVSL